MQKYLLFVLSTTLAVAQNRPTGPPEPVNYDYAGQIAALHGQAEMQRPVEQSSPQSAGLVPSDFRPRADIALDPTAEQAVRVSDKWRVENAAPSAGPDGRVLYSFGAGLPTVVCAPLRVCLIELQAGERIEGEPQIGDAVRWHVSPAMYGKGEVATSVIILKPQVAGLDTNLVVTTDRRAYYLRLVSKPEDYVARVAFQYPEEDNARRWQQHLREQQAVEREVKRSAAVLPAIIAVEKLNFGYRLSGSAHDLRPIRVFDDGAKTYIQMPPELKHREAPALLVLGSDGKGTMTNYRVREQTYIVDRLFDRARLVLGSGKKAQKMEIIREPRG